jgi:type IV pilus assembly protein PilV
VALNQRVYTITISWDDARAANTTNAAEARRSFVLTSRVAIDPVAATP